MKYFLIHNAFPPYSRYGAEAVVCKVADLLSGAGHAVTIVTIRPYFRHGFPQQAIDRRIAYIKGIFYSLNKLPKFLRFFWHVFDMFDLRTFLVIYLKLKKEKPAAVFTHNLKGIGLLVPFAVRLAGVRHVHTCHDIQLLHPSGLMLKGQEGALDSIWARLYQAACRRLFDSAGAVIAPSAWLMDLHAKQGFFSKSEKLVMLNPVNPDIACLDVQPASVKGFEDRIRSKFRFVYVGQLEAHKGIETLTTAFSKIEGKFQDVELIIVGGGSLESKLRSLAGGKVLFKGRKAHSEALEILARADCLVYPSICYENSPMTICEAFAAEVPVIASDIGGVLELADRGRALTFEAGKADDLMAKMRYIMDHPDEASRMAQAAKAFIRRHATTGYLAMLLRISQNSHIIV